MRPSSTVFSQVMSTLHPQTFARCAALFPLRRQPRGLSVYDHFLALCFAQLTYRESLRDLEACLNARPAMLYHLGFRGRITRTNLAYANQRRSWRLFAALAQVLMRQAHRLYQHDDAPVDLPEAAFALDASLIHLSARLFPWAGGGKRCATAIKLHLLLALRGNLPAWALCTKGPFPEVKMLDTLPVEPGCFHVMDRGYLDFHRLHRLTQQRAFFVVRARKRCGFVVRQSQPVDKTTGLHCDQIIRLTNPHSRRAYPEMLRRVRLWDAVNQKSLALLTNHFEAPAQSLAELYRRRWQIELFFKWIKQHLRLRGFFGTTPNAVQCQVWSAICVYLLVAILKKELGLPQSLHEILQILSLHPFEQSPIQALLMKTRTDHKTNENQKLFDFNIL
jgi:Transposase DDE domain/Domain of unknown function (DUF4372)